MIVSDPGVALADPAVLPSTAALLASGGDARIAIDPATGANQYGCPPQPDSALLALGSSTASVISPAGLAAAEAMRLHVLQRLRDEPPGEVYADQMRRLAGRLVRLCGVEVAAPEVVFSASGTDLHLIAAQLCSAGRERPLAVFSVAAAETGSGVPNALAGCHFSSRTALGREVCRGEPLAGGPAPELTEFALRDAAGHPRPAKDIDAEVAQHVAAAVARGQHVLMVLADVSKTGLLAPSADGMLELQRRHPGRLTVLVDACQFRLAPQTLRAYLGQGWMVGISGSKFLTGPTFSGALLIPSGVARGFSKSPPPAALAGHCARGDWPAGWPADALPAFANWGLLLRWEAALAELAAFRAVPDAAVAAFLDRFATAVRSRLSMHPNLEALPVPPLPRAATGGWDGIQTIFPFLLRGRRYLHVAQTREVYRLLAEKLPAADDMPAGLGALRCRVGQPVACGERDGVPLAALRLCASARLVVEACSGDGRNAQAVIDRAILALDKAVVLATRFDG